MWPRLHSGIVANVWLFPGNVIESKLNVCVGGFLLCHYSIKQLLLNNLCLKRYEPEELVRDPEVTVEHGEERDKVRNTHPKTVPRVN